jgi:twitching motility protein PilU
MERVLRLMAEKSASDVYLSANTPVLIKIHGQILQLSDQLLTPQQIAPAAGELLTPQQLEELDDTGELNLASAAPGGQLPPVGLQAARLGGGGVPLHPHRHPGAGHAGRARALLSQLVLEKRGLILMVGATGTGKSTTLASMLEWRNRR